MAGAKEIRTKIKSIKNTQKITSAMEMVAASKMRKAQDRMYATRPYANKMRVVICHLAHANPEYQHAYMKQRKIKRVAYILVSSDRGLCGGLNNNAFRAVLNHIQVQQEQGREITVCTIGKKAHRFFQRFKTCNVVAHAEQLGDAPQLEALIGPVKSVLDAYCSEEADCVYLVFNRFVNTMTQTPSIEPILPIKPAELDKTLKHHWDYLYEPDAKDILNDLMIRYIESLVYQAVVENIACEQASRMIAMKAASDNAGNLIDELQLIYNKARQAAITQEISEIVGGAAAV